MNRNRTRSPRERAPSLCAGRRSRAQTGETLLLTLVWAMAALVGTLAVARSIAGTVSVSQGSAEETAAVDAAERVVQEFEQFDFDTVFARFNAVDTDDPASGASPGGGFAVPGLDPVEGDADGLAGEIVFPTLAGWPEFLSESPSDDFPGLPLDLDLDGASTDEETVTLSYRMLPVVVRVRWRSLGGERVIELSTVLVEAQP